MNSKVYKWCAVPLCTNTCIRTPNKVFFDVPNEKKMRLKWLMLARRDPNIYSPLYFCEDHFDLPNDMANYMEYHIMGSASKILTKPGCVPTKFECQANLSNSEILNKQKELTQVLIEAKEEDYFIVVPLDIEIEENFK